jgi:dienelactone hydrolase
MRNTRPVLILALTLLAAGCATTPAPAIVVEEVSYADGDRKLNGVLAYDSAESGKRPGVLIVHEWWGVTPHVHDYARALASKGYVALAVDMYGSVAEDPKAAGALMKSVMGAPEVMRSRFAAARRVLAAHHAVDPTRVAAVGFSMGGRVVLQMARAGENLAGVASIYGTLETPDPARAELMRARVLIIHAEGDPFVKPDSIPAFRREMEAAKVDYRLVAFPGVKHGFANPMATERGRTYNLPIGYDMEADRKARAELFGFLSEVFAKPSGNHHGTMLTREIFCSL